jgi:hypothetical protein
MESLASVVVKREVRRRVVDERSFIVWEWKVLR